MSLRPSQLSKMCRICTKISENVENIFENEKNGKTLADKILLCTQIHIEKQDNRPSKICSRCFDELERVYEFRKLVEKSEYCFLEMVLSMSHTNSCDEENISDYGAIEVKMEEYSDNKQTEQISSIDVYDLDQVFKEEPLEPSIVSPNSLENRRLNKRNEKTRKIQKRHQKSIRSKKCTKDIITPKVFECYKCREKFTSFWKTSTHLKQHDAQEKYKCIVCGSKFVSWEEYNRHLCQGSSIQCSYCNETFFATAQLLEHLEKTHNEKTLFKCEKCGHFYSMLLLKQYHMVQHVNEHSKPFVCEICGKGFGSRISLRNHEEIHSDEKRKKIQVKNKSNVNF